MSRPDWAPEPHAIPTEPGVYRWTDEAGHTLYVGKAKDLRARLRSYYDNPPERTQHMLNRARYVTWTITASEADALVLERAWINSYDPPYNIKLRHSGHALRVMITSGPIPRARIARGEERKGTTLYGPWPGESAEQVLEAVRDATGIATCTKTTLASAQRSGRACLLADIGRCAAPCVKGDIDYPGVVASARNLLTGNATKAAKAEASAMERAANDERYEQAAKHRDRAKALRALGDKQTIISDDGLNFDALAVVDAIEPGWALVRVRDGVVASVSSGVASGAGIDPEEDPLLTTAGAVIEDRARTWTTLALEGCRNVPKSGSSTQTQAVRGAWEIAMKNASEAVRAASWRTRNDPEERARAADELAATLGLATTPWRIEALDIAHMQGTFGRAGLGVLEDGQVRTGRAWVVPEEICGDDYASIAWAAAKRAASTSLPEPDLLVIDGGPEQLASARTALTEAGKDWPVISLAKRMEEVFTPGESEPTIFARGAKALHLLQAVRDEAHKQCNTATRKAHAKAGTTSAFEQLRGVGPKKRAALAERFGTLENTKAASIDDICDVDGIGPALAQSIKDQLGT